MPKPIPPVSNAVSGARVELNMHAGVSHLPPQPPLDRHIGRYPSQRMTSPPIFSIVMCFRNAAPYLRQAIESVFSQTIDNWELILIDDASTDDSQAVYRTYLNDCRVRLVRQESQRGIGVNKTLGIRLSRGEFVAIVDGDDAIVPEALEKILAAYREDRRRGMIYSSYCDMNSGRVASWVGPYPVDSSMASGTDVVSHLLTFRRQEFFLADAITDFDYAWDKRAVAGLEEVTRPHFIEDQLYLYRPPRPDADYQNLSLVAFQRIKQWAAERESGVSIIIPYHGRWNQLDRTLESLRAARESTKVASEVILSCWNDDPLTPPWVRKIHSHEGHGFSRGRLLNYGVRHASYRKLFFLDADVMVPASFINDASAHIGYTHAWLPICRDLSTPRHGCDADGWRVYGYGLLGVMKRDFWWAGGWEEWESWGGEDNVMHEKLELNACKLRRNRVDGLLHQHHPFACVDDDASRIERQQRIRATLAEYKSLSVPQ